MASPFSLQNFQNKIKDIARPYNFRADFSSGCFGALSDKETITAGLRTAALPSLTVTPVTVNYFGIEYKIAGAPVYDQLACQFIIDDQYQIRDAWRSALNKVFTYEADKGPGWFRPSIYMGTVKLTPLNTDLQPASFGGTYILSMAWISVLGPISWDQGTKDQPIVFDATIVYSFYTKE